MKKILFFVGDFPSLSETFVLNQIVFMIKRGYDVRVLSIRRGQDIVFHDGVNTQDVMEKSYYLFSRDEWICKYKLFIESVIASLRKIKRFKIMRDNGLLAFCAANKFFVSKWDLREFRPDVVVSHFGPTGVVAQSIIDNDNNFDNAKHFVFFHGYEMSEHKTFRRYITAYKKMAKSNAVFLPISNYWDAKLKDNIPNLKSNVVRMGVDINSFLFNDRSFGDGRKIRLFSACRLVEKKGIEYAIKACALLNIDYSYDIAGNGPLQDSLSSLIDMLGVQDKVRLIGPLKSHEVAEKLSQSDIYILPSITASNGDMEGVPVALMEAMSSGVLCVSTYHSGIPELIDDGISGFLVPERDEKKLRDKIIHISNLSHSEISTIRNAARCKVENIFNVEKEMSKLCSLF
nr:glycosyltransferase [Plesiomonas shigelloides]